jgi:hypothetical protein
MKELVAASAELDQRRAEAAEWFAGSDQEGLMELYAACCEDDPGTLRRLTDQQLDCIQRLAGIAMLQACIDARGAMA